jgi:hypothetical protein
MRKIKVVSGGQTGVDQAALLAADRCGIITGGLCPKGWKTETGPTLWLRDFGLREHPSPLYPPRTKANVDAAHATLIVSNTKEQTGGTKLTISYATAAGKQRGAGLFVAVLEVTTADEVAKWIKKCLVSSSKRARFFTPEQTEFILNVAGPQESKAPGIGRKTRKFLITVFRIVLDL